MSIGNIRKLQENSVALYTERKTLRVSVIRRSGYVYPEKLKRPPLPSSCEISGCKMSAHGSHPDIKCRRTEFLIWNVGTQNSSPAGLSYVAQGGPSACARYRDPSSGWHGVCKAIRINSIRIPLGGLAPPCYQAFVHIILRMLAYPIRICCPDGKHWLKCASLATAHVPPLSNGVSGLPIRTSFAMDS